MLDTIAHICIPYFSYSLLWCTYSHNLCVHTLFGISQTSLRNWYFLAGNLCMSVSLNVSIFSSLFCRLRLSIFHFYPMFVIYSIRWIIQQKKPPTKEQLRYQPCVHQIDQKPNALTSFGVTFFSNDVSATKIWTCLLMRKTVRTMRKCGLCIY